MLSEAVFARNAGQCLRAIEDGYYAGLDVKYFYQTLLGHFRNLLLTKIVGQDRELLDVADEDLARLKTQAGPVSRETLQGLLDLLMAEEENVRRSQNPRLNLESVLVRMCYLEPLVSVEEVLSRMEDLERQLSPGGPSLSTSMPSGDSSLSVVHSVRAPCDGKGAYIEPERKPRSRTELPMESARARIPGRSGKPTRLL